MVRDDGEVTTTAPTRAPGRPSGQASGDTPAAAEARSPDHLLFGVCGSFAQRWRVDPTLVRAATGLLALAGGIGVALYLVGFVRLRRVSVPSGGAAVAATGSDRRRNLAVVAATAAILGAARQTDLWPGNEIVIPSAVVAAAVVLIWLPRPAVASRLSARSMAPWLRIALGAILAIAGVATLADRTGGLAEVGRSVTAIAIALGGFAVIAAPAIGRLLGNLDSERTMRIREEERAALAAHLHDSVLQSLVLIQRSDDPRRMVGLARRQERELRSWLYGARPIGEPSSLMAAVEAAAATIEVDHETRIEVVTVGDAPLDDAARALVGAVREAATNAARHSGADHVDVYVEADDAELVAFVRDVGGGFDPTAIADDRHGIVDSIIGRVERTGGRATVSSAPGEGTEVELRVPRRRTVRMEDSVR